MGRGELTAEAAGRLAYRSVAVDLDGLTDNGLRQIFAPEPPRTAATAVVGFGAAADSSGRTRCATLL
ncbi:hypothetical protein C5469_00595 [Photorhabdus cinerea]|uniref:Uncharacterized protein n=1 Tax=Photorhabdus cinerea TaxID=471575 RepID=A0A7X5TFC6_9GAMM|nr:hypothetical protein [Photorhabdus cinerea]